MSQDQQQFLTLRSLNESLLRILRTKVAKNCLLHSADTAATCSTEARPFSPTTRPAPTFFAYQLSSKELPQFNRTMQFDSFRQRYNSKEVYDTAQNKAISKKVYNYDYREAVKGMRLSKEKQTVPNVSHRDYYLNLQRQQRKAVDYFQTSATNWKTHQRQMEYRRSDQYNRYERRDWQERTGHGFGMFAKTKNLGRTDGSSYYYGNS